MPTTSRTPRPRRCATRGRAAPTRLPASPPASPRYGAPRMAAPTSLFFNDTATTEIYTLSLHDALPISIEVAHQQLHSLPPSLRQRVPAISAGVERAIMKALEKDPGQRFSDIQTFINTLEQEQIAQSRAAAAQTQPAPAQPARVAAPPALPQAVMPKASPPPVAPAPVKGNPPPPRRRDDTTMTRRAFAVGLVGLAAAGGAGGWDLLPKGPAPPAPPAVGPNATPPATQTTVNNT